MIEKKGGKRQHETRKRSQIQKPVTFSQIITK
jgi:hypothetical protein